MRLLQSTDGVSKLIFIISLLVALIVGATLSYVWTMGYYASEEYKLPEKTTLSIEAVEFSAQDTTFFDIVILNPSYSPSSVNVTQIAISTDGVVLQNVEALPSLPYPLNTGSSQTFKGFWNWANHTGQIIKIVVFVADGSGATAQVRCPTLD